MDLELFHLINNTISNSFFDEWMPIISNKLTWIPLYVLFVIIAVVKFKKRSWLPVLALIIAFGLTDLISNSIKKTLKNPRPNHVESLYSIKRVEGGSGYSTPSSHAANHMAIAICASAVLGLAWGWRLLLFAWAVLIGFSRIYNGVHFPSDVLIGFALGGVIALISFKIFQLLNQKLIARNKAPKAES